MNQRCFLPTVFLNVSLLGTTASLPALCAPPQTASAANTRTVAIHMALVSSIRQTDGTAKETIIQRPLLSTPQGKAAIASVGDVRPDGTGLDTAVAVTPNINTNGTITLHISWRQRSKERDSNGEQKWTQHDATVIRKVDPHKTQRVTLQEFPGMIYFMDLTAEEIIMSDSGSATPAKQP